MTTIDKSKPLIPFLFMGCWNEDDSPRVSVSKAIMENPIKTLVLGGDNVYPQKMRIGNSTDFTKVYSQKTLLNGVHMLYGKDIYAALGNHNVDGPMLKTQRGLTEWTMPDRYYSVNFSDYTLVVIDSNLVEDADKYIIMREWLEGKLTELKELGKKYYYVQHDPFISFKKKKKTVFAKISELLGILSKYPPTAILCADTHNYQKGTLQIGDITIQQYVVGTGGAHPDGVNASVGETHTVDGIIYTMDEYIPGYGYLEVTGDETKFIKVSDWRSFEAKGGKRIHKTHKKSKRMRRRHTRKYIKN